MPVDTAVVLAAGVGRRLDPLTRHCAKPLLPLPGGSALDRLVQQLAAAGVRRVLINTHYRCDDFRALADRYPDLTVILRREPQLTGPAGALRAFDEELRGRDGFLVASGDVVHDLDLGEFARFHESHPGALTLCAKQVNDAGRYGVLEIEDDGRVTSFTEKPPLPPQQHAWVSCGLYVVDPSLLAEIPTGCIYDYKDIAARMLAEDRPLYAHRWSGYWNDIGAPAELVAASLDLVERRVGAVTPRAPIDDSAQIASGAQLRGSVHVGARARILDGALLEGPVVVHEGASIGAGATVRSAVVLPGFDVPAGSLVDGGIVGDPRRLELRRAGYSRDVEAT
jgi:NDP-sugar pyrophosphorylase family protein